MGNMLQFRYLGPQTAFKLTQLLPTTPLLPGSEQYVAVMRCELVITYVQLKLMECWKGENCTKEFN